MDAEPPPDQFSSGPKGGKESGQYRKKNEKTQACKKTGTQCCKDFIFSIHRYFSSFLKEPFSISCATLMMRAMRSRISPTADA